MSTRRREPNLDEKKAQIVNVLRTVFDPEIPYNVYDIGLIYDIIIDEKNVVTVVMTLTSPACPAIETLPEEIKTKIAGHLAWVAKANVEITWEPAWTPENMSDDARLFLGF